ncbi:hypothetical protein ACC684_36460, partial [Rhizobium ruizarguesonis]
SPSMMTKTIAIPADSYKAPARCAGALFARMRSQGGLWTWLSADFIFQRCNSVRTELPSFFVAPD